MVGDLPSTSGCPAIGQMAGIGRKIDEAIKTLWDLPDSQTPGCSYWMTGSRGDDRNAPTWPARRM
jgi:hypothetical protein